MHSARLPGKTIITFRCKVVFIDNFISTDRDHRWLEWFEQKISSLPDHIDFEEFKSVLHIKEVSYWDYMHAVPSH